MAIKYKSKKKVSYVMGTTVGVIACLILWLASSAILTSLILNETFNISSFGWAMPIMQAIITFLGGMLAGALVSEKRCMVSVICGGVYLVIMICVAVLFADGVSQNFWLGTLCSAAGCAGASLIHMQIKNPSRSRRRGKRHH